MTIGHKSWSSVDLLRWVCHALSLLPVKKTHLLLFLGFTNSSLYTGNIDFQNIPSGQESYWILPVTSMTVQGNSVTLPTGTSSYAAIDTGTTLVGGPSAAIQAIYAQIPGSTPGTGNYEGYFIYRKRFRLARCLLFVSSIFMSSACDTTVNLTVSFGGPSWPVSPQDFTLTQLSNSQCVGAFFEMQSSGSAPAWIIGDTFLVSGSARVPATI